MTRCTVTGRRWFSMWKVRVGVLRGFRVYAGSYRLFCEYRRL
jgi:hypothetical protein